MKRAELCRNDVLLYNRPIGSPRMYGESPKILIVDNQNKGYELKIKKCVTKKCCIGCCLKRFSVDNNLRLTEDKNYLTIYSPLEKDKHKTSGSRTSANFPLNHLDYWGESMLAHYTNCHLLKIKAALRHKRF